MPRKSFKLGAMIVATACIVCLAAVQAQALEYWNVPGNVCQCWGYGNGGGYHACLVLGPPTCKGWLNPHEVRVPCPPGPPCYDSCGASCGCGEQSMWDQSTVPEAQPQPVPAAASVYSQMMR
jgi:hypothetical protein